MKNMDKKQFVSYLALGLILVFVGSFLSQAQAVGAATSSITENDLEWGEDSSGFDASATADVFYTYNHTTEPYLASAMSAKSVLGKAAILASMSYFTIAYISEIDLETLEITTKRVEFFSSFDPEEDEYPGSVLSPALLELRKTNFPFQKPTTGVSLFSLNSLNFVSSSLMGISGQLGLLSLAATPEYNGSAISVSVTPEIKEMSGTDEHGDEFVESWALKQMDSKIDDNQGYESYPQWTDYSSDSDGEEHYWNGSVVERSFFDNDNATASGVIEVEGAGGDYGLVDENDEAVRVVGGEVEGSMTIEEEDMEGSIIDEAPEEDIEASTMSKAGILSLLGLWGKFKKFTKRVRKVVNIPRKFARFARSSVTKFTRRVKKIIPKKTWPIVVPKKIIHGIKTVKGKFTKTIKSAARKGHSMMINFGDKVKGLGMKIIGPLRNLGKFIMIGAMLIIGLLVLSAGVVIVRRQRAAS